LIFVEVVVTMRKTLLLRKVVMETVTPPPSDNTQAKKPAGRAGVAYPYFDHDDSLDVARKIHENAGGACMPDQLAKYLGYKGTKSGTFQTRISSAKQFGFIRAENGQIVVTDRAMQIISPVLPEDAINAKADAFLSVELFSKVYERYRGTTIPPKAGMRNLLLTAFSITQDRVDPAVRVLFDSAEQAGFFSNGDQTRLVRPATKPTGARSNGAEGSSNPAATPERPAGSGSGGGDGPSGVHAAIVGLLRELPPVGSNWPKRGKQRFIKAFLATLDFVYPDEDGEGSDDDQR
jgi:hypothetical protein